MQVIRTIVITQEVNLESDLLHDYEEALLCCRDADFFNSMPMDVRKIMAADTAKYADTILVITERK